MGLWSRDQIFKKQTRMEVPRKIIFLNLKVFETKKAACHDTKKHINLLLKEYWELIFLGLLTHFLNLLPIITLGSNGAALRISRNYRKCKE